METLPRTVELRDPTEAPVMETPHARVYLRSPAAPLPDAAELSFLLPTSARLVYAPRAGAPSGDAPEVAPDVMLRGNAFRPLHQSERALAATLSVASMRRVESGPESERAFVVLRGRGLAFLENGDTHHLEPGTLLFVPAGEPARLWCQSPEDMLAVVLQPAAAPPAPRRTLASEIAKRRVDGDA